MSDKVGHDDNDANVTYNIDYPDTECEDFDVRLTYRDKSAATGNLEICINNEWQPICAQLFTEADLNVTCRALGFNEYESSSYLREFIEPIISNTAIIFQRPLPFVCSGTEEQLSLCQEIPESVEGLLCSSDQVVRAHCQGKFSATINWKSVLVS